MLAPSRKKIAKELAVDHFHWTVARQRLQTNDEEVLAAESFWNFCLIFSFWIEIQSMYTLHDQWTCICLPSSTELSTVTKKLFIRFLKVVENHLKILTIATIKCDIKPFCKTCKMVWINPICDTYEGTGLHST